jgi:membrane-associated phospholipid phosphatase
LGFLLRPTRLSRLWTRLHADLADLRAHWRRRAAPAASLWPLALALCVPALALAVNVSLAFDAAMARAARTFSRGLVDLFQVVTRAGESGWLFALPALVFAGACLARAFCASRRARAAYGLLAARALYFFVVQLDSGLASQVLKHIVGRARPFLFEKLGPWHFEMFSKPAILASFPSGHTITVFATAASLSYFLPRWSWPLLYLAALPVAASRLIIGAHYPSDVFAGALIGLACAYLTALVFARRKIGFTVAPDSFWPRARGNSAVSAQPFKALFQVFPEIFNVFKTHGKTQSRAFGRPDAGGAVAGTVEGDHKALETAPAVAEAEQLQPVEHGGDRAR